jgi:hypothetical protein
MLSVHIVCSSQSTARSIFFEIVSDNSHAGGLASHVTIHLKNFFPVIERLA